MLVLSNAADGERAAGADVIASSQAPAIDVLVTSKEPAYPAVHQTGASKRRIKW
jgi:hypothetical protein